MDCVAERVRARTGNYNDMQSIASGRSLNGPLSRQTNALKPSQARIACITKATAANVDQKRGAGRMTYRPASYGEMVQDVVRSLIEAIKDGEGNRFSSN